MTMLAEQLDIIARSAPLELRGVVSEVRGLAILVADLPVPVGTMVTIGDTTKGSAIFGEVVGFGSDQTIVTPMGPTSGIRRGDPVVAGQSRQTVWVGKSLLGRVIDALGRPIDGKGPLRETLPRPLYPQPVDPMDRPLIDTPLATGVRAIDALLSIGRGQRIGIFALPGVGKSTLLAGMAKHTAADVSVVCLVGERGRELKDFVHNALGEQGLAKSVVICATGDEPAMLRLRAALVATSIAEHFRDQGKDVLLIMDSVTRFCHAQRQIGLASGEPPATKGYPPSVFAMLAPLMERCGRTSTGSITGLYAVLVDGEDLSDPVAEAARGILDGHVVLSRSLAAKGHYPAIDVLESISRCADDVTDPDHQAARREVLRLVHSYKQVEDLLNIGAYPAGSNPDFDLAIACKPAVDQLLQQGRGETNLGDFNRTRKQLLALTTHVSNARQQLSKLGRQR